MSFKQGKKTEKEFIEFLEKQDDVSLITEATKSEDMREHWDIRVDFHNGDTHYYDIKGIRKVSRYGEKDDTIHWVELRNVLGKQGWVTGKSSHIVFETFNEWIVVETKKVVQLLKDKISYPTEYVSKAKDALYKLYTRKGRKDIITMVLTKDLKEKATIVYEKF